MGQKVNPKAFRLGGILRWHSTWFGGKEMPRMLREDVQIREFLFGALKEAALDRVDIERAPAAVTITISSGKPGFIIGRAGAGAEDLKTKIKNKFFKDKKTVVNLNIQEVARPSLSAHIVMQGVIADIEKRMPFRRVLRMAVERVEKAGAQGIRVMVAGRLNGAEIARTEKLTAGKLPLQKLRADIDYAQGFARTLYGTIGVKVWIYRGDIFQSPKLKDQSDVHGSKI